MEIAIRRLTHIYEVGTPNEKVALEKIDLVIPSGCFAVIVGATGSGKSTLIQHVAGLLRPTEGEIRVGEFVMTPKKSDLRKLRQFVGLTFQYPEHQLFEESVEKDVAFGPRQLGLPEALVRERVTGALRQVGLDPEQWGKRSPFTLSGGERRRVALAGVLAMRPKVLCLDEPTAGLDPRGRREILSLVKRLSQEEAMTVVMVTHSMDEAVRLAHLIVVMHEGRILCSGNAAAVFGQPGLIRQAGLELPAPLAIMQLLAERFPVPLPAYLFTAEDVEAEIFALFSRGKEEGIDKG